MKQNFVVHYIRDHKQIYIFAIIWIVVFLMVFSLLEVPLTSIWYPLLICSVLYAAFVGYDYVRYKKAHRKRMDALHSIDVNLEGLQNGTTLLEKDYRLLLEELMKRKNDCIFMEKNTREDTLSYTTLWTHQIKTPLTALQLMASDLEDPLRGDMLARLFEIEQYADMMLQYLRLEGEQGDYVFREYSVKSMVNQAVKYYARIFISKGISVKVDIPEECKVVTDEKWMVFVLKQLISNSLKYTPKGSIMITTGENMASASMDEGKTETKDNQPVVISIKDTGIGIAPEDLPRIFERGYTGYNGRKDKKATGIGLFLVDRILKALNHEIRIESKVNEGTTVEIMFNR